MQDAYLARVRGLNKGTLTSNPGQGSEVQVLEGSVAVAKFSLVTSKTYRDKSGRSQTRYTALTSELEAGTDIRIMQDLLGRSSIKITGTYPYADLHTRVKSAPLTIETEVP